MKIRTGFSDAPQAFIIDMGSQGAPVIERRAREHEHRVPVIRLPQVKGFVKKHRKTLKGIIVSGGRASVYEKGVPRVPQFIWDLELPVLGICYGGQDMADYFGGAVAHESGQFGKARTCLTGSSSLWGNLSLGSEINVWASHGDTITKLPPGFAVVARRVGTDGIDAMADVKRKLHALQFHPEAPETELGGQMLLNFLEKECGCTRNWDLNAVIPAIEADVAKQLGDSPAVLAFSGGGDSTVTGIITKKIAGKKLLAVVIDAGQLRLNEIDEIKHIAEVAGLTLNVVNAKGRFLKAFRGVVDGEHKRNIFRKLYVKILCEEARKWARHWKRNDCAIVDGTIHPDLIESGKTGGAHIKGHHNAGGNYRSYKRIQPVRELFKPEVRDIAKKCGLPEDIGSREPFPGPGNFIRSLLPLTSEVLRVIQHAYAEVRKLLITHGLMKKGTIDQLVVGVLGKVTGVKGDERSHSGGSYLIGVRAVKTHDYMSAEGVAFEPRVQKEISAKLTLIRGITGVAFLPTDKAPQTIELQ